MKKPQLITIVFSLLLSFITNAQSEKGFYVGLNSGYSLGTGEANFYQAQITGVFNSKEISSTTTSSELVKTNLGEGFNVGLHAGYMFNSNIGFELGANYLFGSEITGRQAQLSGDYLNADISAKMLQIKPTLVFRSGYAKINPYAKVGILIGSGKITNNTEERDGPDLIESTLEFSDGTPIGFHASIGSTYKLTDKLSLLGELNLISLEYAPKKGSRTSYKVNGVEQISGFNVREREIKFVDSFLETGAVPSPDEPSMAPEVPFSFSSLGINIGILYNF